ncbi:hypothetical protein BGZ65_001747, partial [Modicella reniformis]
YCTFNDNFSPAERENAAALKAMINDYKSALKTEYKQYEYESEYKQTVKDAEATYQRAKEQAKQDFERKTLDTVKREVDIVLTTDAFANSDAKTKAKVEGFVSICFVDEQRVRVAGSLQGWP